MMLDKKRPDLVRLRAMELLGRSQADFVEVRMAPIVTDPHASVDSLVDRFNAIVKTIEDRRNAKENAQAPRAGDKPLRLAARNR